MFLTGGQGQSSRPLESAVASTIVGTHRRTIAVLDGSFLIIGDTSWRSEPKILARDDNLEIVIND